MAYDSATDTALASQAYQRALAVAAQRRSQLNTQFGLNADGSMNNTAAGQLGSIYQGNLDSVMGDENAELLDRRRGFNGMGGLAGKATARAEQAGSTRQAYGLQDAATQLGGVAQQEQGAGQDYQNELGNIGRRSAYDLAQTLIANPVYGETTPTPALPGGVQAPTMSQTPAYSYAQLYKSNPKKFQTIKNKF